MILSDSLQIPAPALSCIPLSAPHNTIPYNTILTKTFHFRHTHTHTYSGYIFYYEQEKPVGLHSNPPYGKNLKGFLCLACYTVNKVEGDNFEFTISQNKTALQDKTGLPAGECLSLGGDCSLGLGCNWTLGDSLQSPGLALPPIPFSVPSHLSISY